MTGYPNVYNQPVNYNQPSPNDDYIKTIEKEEELLKKKKENYLNRFQNQQPTLNQTIQVSPTPNIGIKYVNSVEDVSRELVFMDTPFLMNDFSKMFIKNAKGEIREFNIEEVIPKDEKDILIEKLTKENEKLKGMIIDEPTITINDEPINTESNERIEAKTTTNVPVSRTSKNKSK